MDIEPRQDQPGLNRHFTHFTRENLLYCPRDVSFVAVEELSEVENQPWASQCDESSVALAWRLKL